MTRTALALALPLLLTSFTASAGDAPAAEGLKAGTAAPQFKLPVVNEFTASTKAGEAPKAADTPKK